MTKKRSIWAFLGAEHYKLWRTPAVWLMICYPLFVTSLAVLIVFFHRAEMEAGDYNPWIVSSGQNIVAFFLLYPILTAILSYSLFDIEYSHNNFRMLFTLPYKRWTIYVSKMIFIAEVITIAMLVGYLTFLAHGHILQMLIPDSGYKNFDVSLLGLSYYSRLFFSLLFIAVLQYFLNATFRNFAIPISISCFMVVLTLVAPNLKIGFMIPYYSAYHLINEFMQGAISYDIYDCMVFVYLPVIFILNYFMIRKVYTR